MSDNEAEVKTAFTMNQTVMRMMIVIVMLAVPLPMALQAMRVIWNTDDESSDDTPSGTNMRGS